MPVTIVCQAEWLDQTPSILLHQVAMGEKSQNTLAFPTSQAQKRVSTKPPEHSLATWGKDS